MRTSIRLATLLTLLAALPACGGEDTGADATDTTSQLLEQARQQAAAAPDIDLAELGYDLGNPEAPVRVVEFSDFGCGYCRKFHLETFPTIREEFIETGKVEWKFLPFITGMFENSLAATEAAECALEQDERAFQRLSHRLWEDQALWKNSKEPERVLREMAAEAGVNLTRFDACVSEHRRERRIAAATALAGQVGVRGTPTFFVLGYPPLQGALPVEAFRDILTAVYKERTGGGVGG